MPRASLNRHTFVCGATGAGKSQTVRGLLEAATRAGIPWLVVEPAKAEYRLMAARLPGTRGDPDPARASLAIPRPGSTRWNPRPARTASGSRCRPTRTWSGPCSWPPSRPTSRFPRCWRRR